jgi:oligogalacturonide lyase
VEDMKLLAAALFALTAIAASTAVPAADTPREWIDAKTGHRVVRISTAPGMSSLYFHQQSFTPQGDKMVSLRSTSKAGRYPPS